MNDRRTSRHSDDDEEDLEILRLAALKSLHSKKESIPTSTYHSSQIQQNIPVTSSNYAMLDSYIKPENLKRYAPEHNVHSLSSITNLTDKYDARHRLEKLDLNEPYVSQNLSPANLVPFIAGSNAWVPESNSTSNGYFPYFSHPANEAVNLSGNNVQLSPRSLAFVAENNDILMRRKGENVSPNYNRSPCRSHSKSPSYRNSAATYRSLSPPYRPSSERWSVTPPPKSKSRSPISNTRSYHYDTRKSISRPLPSPRRRSPISRRRTHSRSPPALAPSSRHSSPYRYSPRSPKYSNNKRMHSKSPPPRERNRTPRRLSRSPVRSARHNVKSKSPLNMLGKRRSPPASKRMNTNQHSPNQQKRSSSHGHDVNEWRQSNRLRSPQSRNLKTTYSRSRSPVKKFIRRSRDRNVLSSHFSKKRSPFNSSRKRSENEYKKRIRKRSNSRTISQRKRISRSKSAEKSWRDENRARKSGRHIKKVDENTKVAESNGSTERDQNNEITSEILREAKPNEVKESNQRHADVTINDDTNENSEAVNVQSQSSKQPERKTSETNEEDSSEKSDDDGIDLFPSDESESENEGRFKLCTNKKDRDEKIVTLSFTKLGESSFTDCKDLKDVGTSGNTKPTTSLKNDRDDERSTHEGRRREDKFRKSISNRSSRERRRINESSNKRDHETSGRVDDKRRKDRPMFKSTFQAVESSVWKNNGKKIDEEERKNSVQLKRKPQNKDDKDSTEVLSSMATTSSCGSNTTATNAKKSIHLRLGAMTNTFKAPKKPLTWSPSEKAGIDTEEVFWYKPKSVD